MDRSSKATLSPNELATLRGLRGDGQRDIPDGHRHLLLSMGLIVTSDDELIFTDAGHRRLEQEERVEPYSEGQHPS